MILKPETFNRICSSIHLFWKQNIWKTFSQIYAQSQHGVMILNCITPWSQTTFCNIRADKLNNTIWLNASLNLSLLSSITIINCYNQPLDKTLGHFLNNFSKCLVFSCFFIHIKSFIVYDFAISEAASSHRFLWKSLSLSSIEISLITKLAKIF